MLDKILKLGHPALYQVSEPVTRDELPELEPVVDLMAGCVLAHRERYGAGRAIAAPQVGVLKRLIVLNIEEPYPMYNPVLFDLSRQKMDIWDDCMSFPELLVKVRRHRSLKIRFRDSEWNQQTWALHGDMAELLQHEYDHLDGILATMRAINEQSFMWRSD